MKIKHTPEAPCPSCERKLELSNQAMVSWFHWVKSFFPQAHISWSFRDQETQNSLLAAHLSEQPWPTSKHNKLDLQGNPCSEALDLFELLDTGAARFAPGFYEDIYNLTKKEKLPIRWGGNFEHLKDYNHFELLEGSI